MSDVNQRRRRTARAFLLIVLVCVLAAVIPAAVELSRRGWDAWTDIDQFREGLSGD